MNERKTSVAVQIMVNCQLNQNSIDLDQKYIQVGTPVPDC